MRKTIVLTNNLLQENVQDFLVIFFAAGMVLPERSTVEIPAQDECVIFSLWNSTRGSSCG
ncbi:MAG: hypothetical protein PW735_00290 [Acidobacteriaceae bacterium]|nr:hypothetical protein [Acidobacteriaceae bacterium]